MKFVNIDNVLNCIGDNETNGLYSFCCFYERYKQDFTLFEFINIVNDYLRYDDLELFPDYLKAIYRIK